LAWAVVVQRLTVAAVAAAGRAIGLNVSLAGLLVATTTVSLAASLPISIAGLGVREASLPLLLAADGVPRMLAVALGLLWSAIVLAVGLTGGPGHFAAQRRAARAASPNEPVVAAVKDRAA
jgi:glycosyltransferase 2 family protein